MSVHKIFVTPGQKVIVKTRSATEAARGVPFHVRQGTLRAVNRTCLYVEFVAFFGWLSFLNECQWYDMKDNGDTQEVIV